MANRVSNSSAALYSDPKRISHPSNQGIPSVQQLNTPPGRFLMRGDKRHKPLKICVIIFSSIVYAISTTLSVSQFSGYLNNTTIEEKAKEHRLIISPAKVTFSIWGPIYILLLALHIYSIANICRSDDINYLYQVDGLVTGTTLILLATSYILSLSWVVLFLLEDKIPYQSLPMIFPAISLVLVVIVNFAALCSAQVSNFKGCRSKQLNKASKKENALYQIFVVNVIALYFGWTLIAANLSVGIAIKQYFDKSPNGNILPEVLGFKLLLSLSICISIYLFIDIVWLKYTTYTILTYVSFIAGAIGIYFNYKDKENSAPSSSDDETQTPADFPLKQYITIILSYVLVFAAAKTIICIINSIKYCKRRR